MATIVKSRGHEFYLPSHHQFQTDKPSFLCILRTVALPMACNEVLVSVPYINRRTLAMSVCASVVARISTIAWYWTNDDMFIGVALLHWLKK